MGKYAMTQATKKSRPALVGDPTEMSNEELLVMAEMPVTGYLYQNEINQRKYDELMRYREDYERNTGIDYDDNPYPWLSGRYDGYYSPYTFLFEASQSVMSLYSRWYKRW